MSICARLSWMVASLMQCFLSNSSSSAVGSWMKSIISATVKKIMTDFPGTLDQHVDCL